MTNIIRKISVKNLIGGKAQIKARAAVGEGNPVELFKVYGVAKGTKTGTTNYGEWYALLGNFEAVVTETGEVVRATQLFLPDVALDLVLSELGKEGVDSVSFGFSISAVQKPEGDDGVGYEYTAKPLAETVDPLDAIRKQVTGLLESK